LSKAKHSILSRDIKTASSYIDRSIRFSYFNGEALFTKGVIESYYLDYDNAIIFFNKAKEYSNDINIDYNKGIMYFEKGDIVKADSIFRQLLYTSPSDLRIRKMIVRIQLHEKKYDDAYNDLEVIHKLNPYDKETILMISKIKGFLNK